MKNIIFFVFALISFIFSCQQKEGFVPELSLVSDFSIAKLNDTTFLQGVNSILTKNDQVYYFDGELSQVFSFSEDGTNIKAIGRQGRGPGEFLGGGQMAFYNEELFVFSSLKRAIDVFRDRIHLHTYDISRLEGMYFGFRFFLNEGDVFLSSPNIKGSIARFEIDKPNDATFFGSMIEFQSSSQTIFQNNRHVFEHNDFIFAVPTSIPSIERYSLDGDLIETLHLDNLPLMQGNIKLSQDNLAKENVVVEIFNDAYQKDGRLYLLTLVRDESESPSSNTILELDIDGQKMKLKRIIKLEDGWHSRFSVSDRFIWTFCSKPGERSIKRFPFNP